MSLVLVHSLAGTLLLVAGVAASVSPKRRRRSPHRVLGLGYVGLLVLVLPSGLAIGMTNPGLTLFEIATPPTLAMGLAGWWAGRARPIRFLGQPWRVWHIAGMGGSLIGVVTATAFQVVPRVLDLGAGGTVALWVVPTVVGSVLIGRAQARWSPRGHTAGAATPVAAPAHSRR